MTFNLTLAQITWTVEIVGDEYGGNLKVNNPVERLTNRGPRVQWTLRTKNTAGPGAAGSASHQSSGSGPNGLRRTVSACYHAHYDVFQALFKVGATRIKTKLADYRPETLAELAFQVGRRNSGAPIWPITMPECCECVRTDIP